MATSQIESKNQVTNPPLVVTEEDIRRRQAELLDIQIEEAREVRDRKKNEARMAAEAKRQGAETYLKKVLMQQAVQTFCKHLRHDGKPFVDVMKLPGGRMIATCANEHCGKTWEGSIAQIRNHAELRHLFPPDDQIGGIQE